MLFGLKDMSWNIVYGTLVIATGTVKLG